MIWNPWKEIKRLREKLNMVEYHLGLSNMEENNLRDTLVQVDHRLKAAQQTLRAIAAMETPRCSNVVRKITRMAREALGK